MALRISGNRLLQTPKGEISRPTLGRVREAIFNIWQAEVAGCRWLDLCTGSGSMGAEALCHGAASVTGIELAPKAIAVIEQNWAKVAQAEQTTRLLRGNLLTRLPQLAGEQFDLIYFDPPYQSNLYDKALPLLVTHQLLAAQGELAVEHDVKRSLQLPPGLGLRCCKTYGSTAVSFCYPQA
jgi:16S rRNA (guanine966-N2)-methyltransferase